MKNDTKQGEDIIVHAAMDVQVSATDIARAAWRYPVANRKRVLELASTLQDCGRELCEMVDFPRAVGETQIAASVENAAIA